MRVYVAAFRGPRRTDRCQIVTRSPSRARGAAVTAEAWRLPWAYRLERRRILAPDGGPLWLPARTESDALASMVAVLSTRFGTLVEGPAEACWTYRIERRPLRWTG